jgi:hypothetical protein
MKLAFRILCDINLNKLFDKGSILTDAKQFLATIWYFINLGSQIARHKFWTQIDNLPFLLFFGTFYSLFTNIRIVLLKSEDINMDSHISFRGEGNTMYQNNHFWGKHRNCSVNFIQHNFTKKKKLTWVLLHLLKKNEKTYSTVYFKNLWISIYGIN